MKELINSPIFGMILSLIAFEIGCFAYKKTKLQFFNPLFIGISITIAVLLFFNMPLQSYNKGAQFISFFLGPATVILAVPLYKKIELLKSNWVKIILGIVGGSLVSITIVIFLCFFFKLKQPINISMIPKSVTAPIGMEISKQLGGIPEISVAAIIITGIMGAMFGPTILKLFRIKDKIAQGIAIGTASHAVGTTKAMEMGEIEGAMSSLAIGIAGLTTVFLAPLLFKVLERFL